MWVLEWLKTPVAFSSSASMYSPRTMSVLVRTRFERRVELRIGDLKMRMFSMVRQKGCRAQRAKCVPFNPWPIVVRVYYCRGMAA